MNTTDKIKKLFTDAVSIAPLVYLRVVFGLFMIYHFVKYYQKGWFHNYYVKPELLFPHDLFTWLPRFGADITTGLYLLMPVLCLFIILGLFYRASTSLFFVLNAYFFLLDKTTYMNHYYLFVLLSFLMIFLPANKSFSLDALFKRVKSQSEVPGWTIWLVRFQLAVVYIYGGIAKLNMDWFQGQPMHYWLSKKKHVVLIGPYVEEKWLAYFFSYGGVFLDLFAVPFLLWKKTRWPALVVVILFHMMNSQLFNIGIFPWIMIALTLLFLPTEYFRKTMSVFIPSLRNEQIVPTGTFKKKGKNKVEVVKEKLQPIFSVSKLTYGLIGIYCVFQLLVPLRHFLYAGNPSWTEEGHFFSWRMMLRDKNPNSNIKVVDPKTGKMLESVLMGDYLTTSQKNMALRRPEMIQRFCKYVGDKLRKEQKYDDFEIKVRLMASLNGREEQLLIDPNVDMSTAEYNWQSSSWIMPMKTPLFGSPPADVLPQARKKNTNTATTTSNGRVRQQIIRR